MTNVYNHCLLMVNDETDDFAKTVIKAKENRNK